MASLLLILSAFPGKAQTVPPSFFALPDTETGVIDHLPRLPGESRAVAKINRAFEKRDAKDIHMLECAVWGPSNFGERSVRVTYSGPEFLSIFVGTSAYCAGAAHPWSIRDFLTFDLRSGDPVDLSEFLPTGMQSRVTPTEGLGAVYVEALSHDENRCREVLMRYDTFWLAFGLDETSRSLVMFADNLAYVDTPCSSAVALPLDRLRSLGVSPRLIEALSTG